MTFPSTRHVVLLLVWMCAGSRLLGAESESLTVVATRYLQAEGVSHAHLYLYTEDGILLRQLTHFEKGQDHAPMFSPDGKSIVFTRTDDTEDGKSVIKAAANKPASLEFWRVDTQGKDLKRLPSPPKWYTNAVNEPFFTLWQPKGEPEKRPRYGWVEKWDEKGNPMPGILEKPPLSFISPDKRYQLVLKIGEADIAESGPGNGKQYELKDLHDGKAWKLGELPDFLGLSHLLHSSADRKQLFLQHEALNVVFFWLHMGSTFGEATIALDLTKPKLRFLPGNKVPLPFEKGQTNEEWSAAMEQNGNAVPIPLPGEAFFLAVCIKRYEPIPGSTKTANLSYLARFDASLEDTPYVRLKSAPIFYGASLFRPGKRPAVMKIGEEIGND